MAYRVEGWSGWVELDWVGLDRVELDWVGLDRVELDCVGLDCLGLC